MSRHREFSGTEIHAETLGLLARKKNPRWFMNEMVLQCVCPYSEKAVAAKYVGILVVNLSYQDDGIESCPGS